MLATSTVALLALNGCATTPAATPVALSDAPTPRIPTLSACPGKGAASDLPSVHLRCLTSDTNVDMSRLAGRPVLVNLWASWCAPCQRETPLLVRAQARVGSSVEFLGVNSMDDTNSARDFLAAFGVHYPQVVDSSGTLLHRLGGSGLPMTVLLDATGRVTFTRHGELRAGDLDKALASLARRAHT